MIIQTQQIVSQPGIRYRILISYENENKAILWFKLDRDGSLYLAPRYENKSEVRHGIETSEDNSVRIELSKGTEVEDQDARNAAKLSIHPSGTINAPGGRFYREVLRGLSIQVLLCLVSFQHPRFFSAVSQAEANDVHVPYAIDEARPLWAKMFLSPKDRLIVHESPRADVQQNLLFEYEEVMEMPTLIAQLVFGHGIQGEWPRLSGVVFPFISKGEKK
jgi:hypothetical protein